MAKTPEIKSSINSYERRPGLDSREVKFDVPEQDVDHARTAETGIALADVRGIEVDPMTANTKKLLADEKFMAEPVEIQLADPGTEDEHQFAEITVNGERVCIRRGDTGLVKRYHLAALAGAKVQRLVQKKVTQSDGSIGYEERFVLRPLYPFQVLSDANPKGSLWLRQLLQNAC